MSGRLDTAPGVKTEAYNKTYKRECGGKRYWLRAQGLPMVQQNWFIGRLKDVKGAVFNLFETQNIISST